MDEKLKQKLDDSKKERWGCRGINPEACRSCIFAHGDPPFADAPEKAYCMIYGKGTSNGKPPEVYYDGAKCEYQETKKG